MKTRRVIHIINKCFLFICVVLLSSLSSFAAENSLLGIDVKQMPNNGYNILLRLDNTAQINKTVDSEGNLIINLNSTLPSDSMDIIYDNTSDLNNVIVQKKNKDNTVILLQGKNIANAQIFTKELSTGITKKLDAKNSLLSNLLFIADKKIFAFSFAAMFLMFLMMLAVRPKNQRYSASSIKKINKTAKDVNANTLRNKNLIQSKNIPSINYNVKKSLNSSFMSVPKDFVINNHIVEEEIRKVG